MILGEHAVGQVRGHDPEALDAIDRMTVSGRFPIGAALWVLGGLLVAGFLGLVILNAYLTSRDRNFPNMGYALACAVAALSGTIYHLPTLVAFVRAPKVFAIDRDGFQYGARRVAFRQVVGLRHDAGRPSTHVSLQDGSSLRLRWPIWRDSPLWVALLERRSVPHLLAAAIAEIRAGRRVSFGRRLALDRGSIRIGRGILGKTFPIGEVTDFHFVSTSDQGDESRKLKIGTLRSQHVIDERKITNPQVFVGLFKELVGQPGPAPRP